MVRRQPGQILAAVQGELYELRRRQRPVSVQRRTVWVPFRMKGALAVDETERFPLPWNSQAIAIAARLTTTGTTTSTVHARITGVSVGSVSLASGVAFNVAALDGLGTDEDYLTAAVTAAGAGAVTLGGYIELAVL